MRRWWKKPCLSFKSKIPGHDQAHYLVSLGPDNPAIYGLSFEVTEAGILSLDVAELATSLSLFPVPAKDQLSIQLKTLTKGTASLFISDFSGRIVHRQQLDVRQGAQQFNLNIGGLPTGLYTLGLSAGGKLAGKQFVKE